MEKPKLTPEDQAFLDDISSHAGDFGRVNMECADLKRLISFISQPVMLDQTLRESGRRRGSMSARALQQPIDEAACRAFLEPECHFLRHGYCQTRGCYIRGGWDQKTVPVPSEPTCEARQLSELLDRAAKG